MSDYLNETKDIIGDIAKITKQPMLKPLILKLADHVAKGLTLRTPEAINQSKMAQGNSNRHANTPEALLHVSKIVKMLKAKYFPTVSDRWIQECMPAEYKEPQSTQEKKVDLSEISDAQLIDEGADIQRRIKKLQDHGPAQEPKIKKTLEGIKSHKFACDLSAVMAEILENIEKDYLTGKLTDDLVKQLVRRFRTVADKRYAVDECKYEAILLACSTVDSLNNSTKYETEILTRWQMFDREQKCLKCNKNINNCRATRCKCACHESVKRLTTKGLKWAIEHNPHLKKLDDNLEKLSEWEDNICAIGKVILRNPHTADFMSKTDRKRILFDHIEKDKCTTCEMYIQEHPDFFDKE